MSWGAWRRSSKAWWASWPPAYESLVNTMRAAVIKVNGDRVITFANNYSTELLGYSNAELVGQPLERIIPPDWHEQVRQRIESLRGGEMQVNEINPNVTKSGERIWVAWSNRLIGTGDGRGEGTAVRRQRRHRRDAAQEAAGDSDRRAEDGATGRGGGHPGQERLPGQHEPRDPHPDERRHRHDATWPCRLT